MVAVKAMSMAKEETLQEIDVWRRLRPSGPHPNLMHLLDEFSGRPTLAQSAGREDRHFLVPEAGKYYFVFECMDTNLLEFLHGARVLREQAEASHILRCCARGVGRLHSMGVVHADLSLQNVLLRGNFRMLGGLDVRVADVGCSFSSAVPPWWSQALSASAEVGTASSAAGASVQGAGQSAPAEVGADWPGATGAPRLETASAVLPPSWRVTNPTVRAPEVALGLGSITSEADVWALGVVAASLAVGTYDFWCCLPRLAKIPDRRGTTDTFVMLSQYVLQMGSPDLARWPRCAASESAMALLLQCQQWTISQTRPREETAAARRIALGAGKSARATQGRLLAYLQSAPHFCQCLPAEGAEQTADLIMGCLRWQPDDRLSAAQVEARQLFPCECAPEPMAKRTRQDPHAASAGAVLASPPAASAGARVSTAVASVAVSAVPVELASPPAASAGAKVASVESLPDPALSTSAASTVPGAPDPSWLLSLARRATGVASETEAGPRCRCETGNCGRVCCRKAARARQTASATAAAATADAMQPASAGAEGATAVTATADAAIMLCSALAVPGSRFCLYCKCESASCQRNRRGHEGAQLRWCGGCALSFLAATSSKIKFVTPWGIKPFPKPCCPALMLVLKWNFAWRRVYPDDGTAFRELAVSMGCGQGAALSDLDLVVLFVGHAWKWPTTVRLWSEYWGHPPHGPESIDLGREAQRRLEKLEAQGHIAGVTSTWGSRGPEPASAAKDTERSVQLLVATVNVVEAADGWPWPCMFKRMNMPGRMSSQSGLQVHASQLGVISTVSAAKATAPSASLGAAAVRPAGQTPMKKAKAAAQASPKGQASPGAGSVRRGPARSTATPGAGSVRLGPAQSVVHWRDDVDHEVLEIFTHFLRAARKEHEVLQRWPADAAAVPAFMEALKRFARDCRSFSTASGCGWRGGRGGASVDLEYLVMHWTRAMLDAIEEHYLPEATATRSLAEVLRWTPDQAGLMADMQAFLPLRAREVEHRTGVRARDLSWVACLVKSGLSQDQCQSALRRPTVEVMRAITTWEAEKADEDLRRGAGEHIEDPTFPPGPKALAEAVLSGSFGEAHIAGRPFKWPVT